MSGRGTLAGRSALVTGAAGGIGQAVVVALVSAGARVLAVDVAEQDLAETEQLRAYACSLTEPAGAAAAVAGCVERFGGLDVAVNTAGASGRGHGDGPIDRCTDEGWAWTLDVNLTSMFYSCRAEVRQLLAQGRGGAVVNVSSVLALVGGDADFATHAYAASKGAIVSLTRAIAATYATDGISASVVCPGLIATPMSARAQADERIVGRLAELQPLTGALGTPADVAAAVLYLAGPGARFGTGVVLPVDGGWTAR